MKFKKIILSAVLLGVVFLIMGHKKNSALDIQNNPLAVQDKNRAPVANSISKPVLMNNSFVLSLASLSLDADGDEFKYMIIEQLPKHGSLSLIALHYGTVHYVYADTADPSHKKFDGRWLKVKYSPDKDFIGTDSFSYLVFDARGAKSNTGVVTVSVNKAPVITKNHSPEAHDLTVTTTVKVPVYVSLESLTFDADGDKLRCAIPGAKQTFVRTPHGVRQGSSFIDYLPETAGVDVLPYYVWDTNYEERKTGTLKINIVKGTAQGYNQRDRRGGLKGFRNYLNSLPALKRFSVIIAHAFFYFIVAGMSMFFFSLALKFRLNSKLLRFIGAGLFIFGTTVLLQVILKIYSVKVTSLSIVLMMGGIYCLFSEKTGKWGVLAVRFLRRHFFLVLLIILNGLILGYHCNAISLPATALDAYGFMALYNFFKYGILSWVRQEQVLRLAVPFLASLIPLDDPVSSFKIINVIFINLAVILLYKIWRKLNIRFYLIPIAFFWLFFHQYGAVRFYNFWPTSIDVPTYFFNALLVYIIFKKKYKLLLLISPLAVLQRESFLLYISAFLFYKVVSYYFLNNRAAGDKNTMKIILFSIILALFAAQLAYLINPQPPGSFLRAEAEALPRVLLGTRPLWLVILAAAYFINYGGLLLLSLQSIKNSYQKTDLFNALIIFSAVNCFIVMSGITNRAVFLGYPFIMTLILLSLNKLNPLVVGAGLVLSLPLMRIYVDFPFVKYPLLQESPMGNIAAWGVYMILLSAVLYYLKNSGLPAKVMSIMNKKFQKK